MSDSVGAVPETSVPIRFRVLQFEDRFDSGSYLTSRPRFQVGSGRVYGSSICIFLVKYLVFFRKIATKIDFYAL